MTRKEEGLRLLEQSKARCPQIPRRNMNMETVTQVGEVRKLSLSGAPQVVVAGEGIAVAGVKMSSVAARELAMELIRAADRVDGVGQPAAGWWAGALRAAAKALGGSDHAERLELIADGLTPAWSSAP